MNELQKRTAQAIVNIFETGSVRGKYGMVTLIPGDRGHLTYGRSQTTLTSGGLHWLILDYCKAEGARFDLSLSNYLPRLEAKDLRLDDDATFWNLLDRAGDDPVMHAVQDKFFDKRYWAPALRAAKKSGITTALGIAVVYDSYVHGSWGKIRNLVNRRADLAGGELGWIRRYVFERRAWLASKGKPLSNTVYRMDAFENILDAGNWDLALPLKARGKTISLRALGKPSQTVAATPKPRVVYSPRLSQNECYGLQAWLIDRGHDDIGGTDGKPDCKWGPKSARAFYIETGCWLAGTPAKVMAEIIGKDGK